MFHARIPPPIRQGAEEVARITRNRILDQVHSLVRDYYEKLASTVRQYMTNKGMGCAAARASVAASTLQWGVDPKRMVKSHACRAAATLLMEAGDEWVTTREATKLSRGLIGGDALWAKHVTVSSKRPQIKRFRCNPHAQRACLCMRIWCVWCRGVSFSFIECTRRPHYDDNLFAHLNPTPPPHPRARVENSANSCWLFEEDCAGTYHSSSDIWSRKYIIIYHYVPEYNRRLCINS